MALMSAAGAVLGALLATVVPADVLEACCVPVDRHRPLLRLQAEYRRHRQASAACPVFLFTITFVPLIGLYDGVFGPGTGSFFMLGFVSLAGYGILKATAHSGNSDFGSNIGAFFVFLLSGVVLWKIGPDDGRRQFLGAQVGSRMRWQRARRSSSLCWSSVSIALAIRLLADPGYPLRIWMGCRPVGNRRAFSRSRRDVRRPDPMAAGRRHIVQGAHGTGQVFRFRHEVPACSTRSARGNAANSSFV